MVAKHSLNLLPKQEGLQGLPFDELAHKYEEIVRQTDGVFTVKKGTVVS